MNFLIAEDKPEVVFAIKELLIANGFASDYTDPEVEEPIDTESLIPADFDLDAADEIRRAFAKMNAEQAKRQKVNAFGSHCQTAPVIFKQGDHAVTILAHQNLLKTSIDNNSFDTYFFDMELPGGLGTAEQIVSALRQSSHSQIYLISSMPQRQQESLNDYATRRDIDLGPYADRIETLKKDADKIVAVIFGVIGLEPLPADPAELSANEAKKLKL